MADMTTYLMNALANHVLRNTSYTAPTTIYVALFTDATGDGGTCTELSGDGYERQSMAFDAASSGATDNTSAVTFGPATADWGFVTHVALYDSNDGGNMLMHDALTTSRTVNDTDEFKFSAGELDVTFA